MTDSVRTQDDAALQEWPRWSWWMLGDLKKLSVTACLCFSAVFIYNGVMATWRFFTETGDGWTHSVQVLGPFLIAGGFFYLWVGMRLRRLRARADQPTSPAAH
ncbi:hypothetical protein ACHABX_12750 [Nesterenkonia halotolerans]|uniref:hypothetical protein n=1 Tax=Nesterenkonia halotolerans TaxID=225325 RepID=UPI003EE4D74A